MSGVYAKAKERMWTGALNVTSTVVAVGVSSAQYTVDYSAHEFVSSLVGQVTTTVTLAGVTYAAGKFTANSITLSTPTAQCDAVVIYQWTGTPTTSPLICYIDNIVGFPGLPADGTIPIDWDTTVGIVSL